MTKLEESIVEALNIALGNGYDMLETPDEQVAVDLVDYNIDFENAKIDDLIPGIRIWKLQRREI